MNKRHTLHWLIAALACLLLATPAAASHPTGKLQDLQVRAQGGDAQAQNDLGVALTEGFGSHRDDVSAVDWFRKAALQGLVEAQYNLSVMYANGQGVRQDDNETVKWTRAAATQGHAAAQYQFGLLYAVGAGVEQDYVKAYQWFSLAASRLTGMDGEIALEDRDLVAEKMSTEQIAEAQRLVRDWKPSDGYPVLASKDM